MSKQSELDAIKNWPQLLAAVYVLYQQITELDISSLDDDTITELQQQINAWQTLITHADTLRAYTDLEKHNENLQQLADLNSQLVTKTENWRGVLSTRLSGQLKTRSALSAYSERE